jgi:hypothetical protein
VFSTKVRPYRSAVLARRVVVKIAGSRTGVVEIHTGHASDGYRSDHTRRPVAWWTVQGPFSDHVYGTRYAGNRLTGLPAELAQLLADLRTDPDVSAVTDSGWLADVSAHWPGERFDPRSAALARVATAL